VGERLVTSRVRELVAKESSTLATPQMASYLAYNESPILRPKLRDIGNLSNLGNTGTVRKEQQYSLQDIETKCT
jgi:hypothetical protein